MRVSTGIRVGGSTWNSEAEFYAYTHCLACGNVHRRCAEDATLCDEVDAARSKAIPLANVIDFVVKPSRRGALALVSSVDVKPPL